MEHSQRPYDLIVFGASGYTGTLIVKYLASLKHPTLKVAVAGRDPGKLQPVLAHYEKEHPENSGVGLIEADVTNQESLEQMAQQGNVVLTTVGPYEQFGHAVVDACVAQCTHYVDITGEPSFVSTVITNHHEQAKSKKLRVVNCCGFDSVPHDLGAYYVVKQLKDQPSIDLQGFVQAKGGISGGTWHSAIHAMSQSLKPQHLPKQLPAGSGERQVKRGKASFRYDKRLRGWAIPLPTIDGSIVRRSARALEAYGADFRYAHFMKISSLVTVSLLGMGLGAVALGSKWQKTRDALLKLRPQGEGPDAKTRENGWFRVTFFADTPKGYLMAEVEGGEPGYHETSRWAAQCALLIATEEDTLPANYGVITPAMAFGDALLERMQDIGNTFRHQWIPK